jgi:mono/diheme cytochrome c family protein
VARWLALGLLIIACTPGQYPVDIFPEMHYQPSQRRLEPDRSAPPPGAVPTTGGRPEYTYAQASNLPNPIVSDPTTLQRASTLYQTNCAMCHGLGGRGDGPVAPYFELGHALPPTDFASARVRNRTDGELYWLVTYGIGNMPPFHDLLGEADTWTVVHFIRQVQLATLGVGGVG